MKIKVHLRSSISNQDLMVETEVRDVLVLPTGTVIPHQRPGCPEGAIAWDIEWVPSDAVAAVLRKARQRVPARLTGGKVRFDYDGKAGGNYVLYESQKLRVRVADKPDLFTLWQWVVDYEAAETAARNRAWENERYYQQAQIRHAKPAGSVMVKQIGRAPDPWEAGMSVGVWQAKDGRTFAGEPDAQKVGIGYITEERLALCATSYAAETQRDAERNAEIARDRAKYQADLRATIVPADALAAYRRYHGNSEKAWEESDESAWADIERYRDAIEVQGLASPSIDVIRRECAPEDLAMDY